MDISEAIKAKAELIETGAYIEADITTTPIHLLAIACALLTSPVKAERERGKQMVRDWRHPENKKPA